MAVDEIIEDVLSLELNDSSMFAQSSHNPNYSNTMQGNLNIVSIFFFFKTLFCICFNFLILVNCLNRLKSWNLRRAIV